MIHENIIGIPKPPRKPVAAGSKASICSTAGEPMKFMKNKPIMIVREINSLRVILDKRILVFSKMQIATTSPIINPHNSIENPPMDIVSVTGG